jgi:hypothetical protein
MVFQTSNSPFRRNAVASLRSVIVFRNAIEPDRFKIGTQPSAARSAAAFVQHRRSPLVGVTLKKEQKKIRVDNHLST